MPGSFDGPGATTLPTPPAGLASFIGQVPASLNMLIGFFNDGTTQTGQFTDFTTWDDNTNLTIATGLPSFDGTSNCQKLIATVTNGSHSASLNQLAPQLKGTPHTFRYMAVAKAAEYTRIVLSISCFEFTNSTASFGFDLAGGNTNYDQVIGANITVVGGSAHMMALAKGFYLCYFDFFFNSNNSFGGSAVIVPIVYIDNGSGTGARSISFAGNGTSGLNVLICSLLPTPMWTLFGTPTFFDDFENLNTVDINNTQAPGFNWYINTLFAQGAYTAFGWYTDPPSGISPAEMFTQPAPSIIQVYEPNLRPAGDGFNQGVFSVVPNGSGGLIGTSFRGTQVREIFSCWNQALQSDFNPSILGSAGMTGYSIESRINGGLNSLNDYRFLEWNTMETDVRLGAFSGTNSMHAWFGGPSPSGPDIGASSFLYNNMYIGNFVRTTSVWIDGFSDPNAPGWGAFYSFINGQGGNSFNPGLSVQVGVYNFSSTTGSQIDGQHICLTFGTSTNTAGGANPIIPGVPVGGQIFQVDWVRVFSPTTPIVYYVYWDMFDGGADLTLDPTGTILNNTSGANFEAMRVSALGGKTSGKWYWEYKLSGAGIGSTNDVILGIMNFNASITTPAYPGSSAQGAGLQYNTAANTNINGVTGDYSGSITWAANDVIGFALDLGAGKCWIHKNGTWLNGAPGGSTDVWSGISAANAWYAAAAVKSTTATVTANFGASAFAYTVPSGFSGWTQ